MLKNIKQTNRFNQTQSCRGFTIIEVVLVLAIAGLIFLMVFIALPALNRGQRNTQRKQDMSRIMTAFTEFKSNNGHMPETNDEVLEMARKYIIGNPSTSQKIFLGTPTELTKADGTSTACDGDKFCDPDGSGYLFHYNRTLKIDENGGKPVELKEPDPELYRHVIEVYRNATCSGSDTYSAKYKAGDDNVALLYMLEGDSWHCVDNQ